MRIKRTVRSNEDIIAEDISDVVTEESDVSTESDEVVVESDKLTLARNYIQKAIDCLCEIASTNNKAQTAIVDLGVISLDLSV